MTKYNDLVGKIIRILALPGDPAEERYIGRTGVVKEVAIGFDNEPMLWGTWGSIAIFPEHDKFEVVEGV